MDDDQRYRALTARDRRFDGAFIVAVTSTRIYCRCICPARTPRRDRCRFYALAAQAEAAGFRPCLRCRPELAPGLAHETIAPTEALSAVVAEACRRIAAGALDETTHSQRHSVTALALKLGIGERQLRRAFATQLGISPLQVALTRRLHTAKELLTDSVMPTTAVAFASGFASVRRFNAAFRNAYHLRPTTWRRQRAAHAPDLTLSLSYRPPFAWDAVLHQLAGRAVAGCEAVSSDTYRRALMISGRSGIIAVRHDPAATCLRVTVPPELVPVLVPLRIAVRRMFDLDAEPGAIADVLATHPRLATWITARPGLRLIAACDPFEAAVRAILGQQISVRAATTIAGRLATQLGTPLAQPADGITHLAPDAQRLANADIAELTACGLTATRAATVIGLAQAIIAGSVTLDPLAAAEPQLEQLAALRGIGPWTVATIALRALAWPDAFPAGDLGLRQAFDLSDDHLRAAAEAWRPWRAYAAVHGYAALSASVTSA